MPASRERQFPSSCLRNQRRPVVLGFAFTLCAAWLILVAESPAQTLSSVFDFSYASGVGYEPSVPLIAGAKGALYGTTVLGGDLSCGDGAGCGTIFQLTQSEGEWTHSTLYEFHGGKDGVQSISTLALGDGRLFGVTNSGTPYGALYQLTPNASGDLWHFALIYEFTGQADGAYALSPLVIRDGAIYGATQQGGLHGEGCNQQFGCGSIFQLIPPTQADGAWTESTLYDFKGMSDGGNPSSLIMDSAGTIYGTTYSGGSFNSNCSLGCGVIFKLAPQNGSWKYSVIYDFQGRPDEVPYGNLIADSQDNLYGLVEAGFEGSQGGAIYQLTPPSGQTGSWTLENIHGYPNTYPATNLTLGSNGVLYGDIYADQDLNAGYVFQLKPPGAAEGWTYTTLANFNNSAYQNPEGVLLAGGELFVTISGGGYSPGNIVSIVP
jgi:hypothetical protein